MKDPLFTSRCQWMKPHLAKNNLIPNSLPLNGSVTRRLLLCGCTGPDTMKKILLIEDDSDLFALLKYNLEKEGFSLSGLQTGKGAIELCRQVRPDLILLDIMLPDSDGL